LNTGTSDSITTALAVSSDDSVYFSSDYTGTPSITKEDGTSVATLPNSSGVSSFIAKFTSSNAYSFSRVLNPGRNYSVAVSDTRVFFAGYYTGTSSVLGPGSLATFSRENAGYVVALDTSGTYQWNILVDNEVFTKITIFRG
jgi:hypothetical protein